MLDKLRIAKYRFRLEAKETLHLPPYKGSALRGGFGYVFKRTVCFQRQVKDCTACLLKDNCPYAYIFETSPPQEAEVLRTYSDVPLPFVIEPPLDTKTVYQAGETLDFDLVLVGRAINYLPYFIVVFGELGKVGLGRGRGKYGLKEVRAVQPLDGVEATIYSASDEMVHEQDLSVGWEGIKLEVRSAKLKVGSAKLEVESSKCKVGSAKLEVEGAKSRVIVNFLTPTRLKHGGHYVSQPDFHVLVRGILRRVSSLYYFHCGERWETDYRGTIERARGVKTVKAETEWVEWERYSGRQKRRVSLGGFVGEMEYEGDLAQFRPLLLLGQLVHVGKACVFGHGHYVVV